jgi:DNA gyrase inhibitor GyrI
LISPFFEWLGAIAGRAGLFAHSGALWVAAYDDDPEGRAAEELRSRAGISIPEGPALEIYRTDMRSTPKAEWRTDLLVPVR